MDIDKIFTIMSFYDLFIICVRAFYFFAIMLQRNVKNLMTVKAVSADILLNIVANDIIYVI